MAKRKARMKVWALNTGTDPVVPNGSVYELKVSEEEPPKTQHLFSDRWGFVSNDTTIICADLLEQFTSIKLKPGKVGRINLRTLKALKLVGS